MPPSTDIASVATSFAPAFDPHEWSTAMSDEDLELFERTRRTHSVFLNGSDKEAKRREIYEYFNRTWELEDKLYEILHNDASFYKYAIPLRHPLIFYLAHTASFFVNKLHLAKLITKRINPSIESVSAVGVDEFGFDDVNPEKKDWPSVAEVREFREKVRSVVNKLIMELPLGELPIHWDHPWWVFLMCIEHARIHIETSSVLIRQLPLEEVKPISFWNRCTKMRGDDELDAVPKNELLHVNGVTNFDIGKKHETAEFYGWDVEYGEHIESISAFKASKFLVSNKEFAEFVQDGGYETRKYWTEEGWKWREFAQATHPTFWVRNEKTGNWSLRLLYEEIPMPWDWPVEVNNLEATAFCSWKAEKTGRQNIRLPTEAEWHVLRAMVPTDLGHWDTAPGNINLEYWASSCPIDMFQQTATGFHDIIGNVWQHTVTNVAPFKHYKTHPLYDDFSMPTFDFRHSTIQGGSWISTGNEATRNARYAFRRHFFQHAGFRYVESSNPVPQITSAYEGSDLESQYIDLHYGSEEYFGVPLFPKAMADLCITMANEHLKTAGGMGRALDLGCSVGRSVFELATAFNNVIGLDFSANFIRITDLLSQGSDVEYSVVVEGDIKEYRKAKLAQFGLENVADRVNFFQADACNLDPKYNGYDLVLAANLIDRLYSPAGFLSNIHTRINSGGLLVISSPYTWLQEHTLKEQWIGGYIDENGKPVTTLEGLHRYLDSHFDLVCEPIDVPLVIRETARKFQHTLSQATVWRKRD